MWYELWSLTSRNLMHDFESEAEATAAVRDYLDDGALTHDELALVVYDDAGTPTRSVTGPELTTLAYGASAERSRRTA